MKIIKWKMKKNNLYELILDDNSKLELYDDIILKYELLIKKEIDKNILDNIIKDNNYITAYNKSLKYLNIKMRTTSEIEKKLKEYDKDIINYVIKRLKKEGYLNNDDYIEAYINDAINFKIEGSNKIIRDLKNLGFNIDEINNYLDTISSDVWNEKIEKYITKKIKSNHNLSSLMLKNKIIKDLENKGFILNMIINNLDKFEFKDDSKIYEKEYNKIKNKLSKKYSGEELNYEINNYLYKKGFRK